MSVTIASCSRTIAVQPARSRRGLGRAQPIDCRRRTCWPVRRDGGLAVDPEPPGRRPCARDTPTRGPLRIDPAGGRRPPQDRSSGRRAAAGRARCAPGRCRGPGQSRAGPRARSRPASRRPPRAGGPRHSPATTSPARSSTRRGRALGPADEVGAPVHAVGEVDVERAPAARTSPRCAASGRGRRASRGRPARRTPRPRSAAPPPGAVRRAPRPSRSGRPRATGPVEELPRQRAAHGGRSHGVCGRHQCAAQAALGVDGSRSSASCSLTRSGAVPPCALRAASAPAHGEHLADLGRQVRRDLGELLVGEVVEARVVDLAPDDQVADRPRAPRGTARPGGPALGDVGGQREARAGPSASSRSVLTRMVAISPATAGSTSSSVSTASKTGSLSSCRSRL